MTEKRRYVSHKDHNHPHTKNANAACRRVMDKTGLPLGDPNGVQMKVPQYDEVRIVEPTRAANKAARVSSATASVPDDRPVVRVDPDEYVPSVRTPKRNSKGKFMSMALGEWRDLIASLEQAQEYLSENATLLRVEMQVVINNQTFICSYDGQQWEVGTE